MTPQENWIFANDAYLGTGGFDDKSYIDKHTRESDDKFTERKKIAIYTNKFVQKVGRYTGYLFKTSPIRISSDKMIQEIFADCDNTGSSMSVFMSSFAKGAKVRGTGIVLVDMPSELSDNVSDQIENRELPYFVNIKPEDIESYKLDRFGNFVYVAYNDTIDESTYETESIRNIIRYYDSTEWKVYEDDKVIESGVHGLGVCPIQFFGENGVFPDVGEFTQVSGIAKKMFNLDSEMDDIMRGQTFSILTLNADNPSDVTITLSTDNAIKYGQGMDRPGFIAPDASPADIYEKKLMAKEDDMNAITYDISTGLSAESGLALSIKFQGMNGSLSNFASRLEDFEKRLFDVAARYLGITPEIEIMYPTEFNVTDIEQEIATLDAIKAMGYTLPNYERLKLKSIVGSDLTNVSDDQLVDVYKEIDNGLQDVGEVEIKE